MKIKTDILVVSGGPAGIVSAVTARKYYPDKKITVMKDVKNGVVPCGIPYMFFSLKNPEDNMLGTDALTKNRIKVVVEEKLEKKASKSSLITVSRIS